MNVTIKRRCMNKNLEYELDYLRRKFKLGQILIFIISLFAFVITGFGDTTSFFVGEDSPIPKEWLFLKNPVNASIISTIIIALPYILVWIYDFRSKNKEDSELSNIVKNHLIPTIEHELTYLKRTIKNKFQINDDIRLSIFVPVRASICSWNLQMVCRTKNISERELLASFRLYEGVLGYMFLKTKKHSMEFVDVSNSSPLPSTYIPLTQENNNLINRNIKGVLIAAAFQEGSVAGLLAIDTDNSSNLQKMQDYELHDIALDWIIARSGSIKLLWRMKNNV